MENFKLFYVKECDCNALVLLVKDENGWIKELNKYFSKFDILKNKVHSFYFVPHVTVAYVKKDF